MKLRLGIDLNPVLVDGNNCPERATFYVSTSVRIADSLKMPKVGSSLVYRARKAGGKGFVSVNALSLRLFFSPDLS
jgi:hypothetical protein